MLVIVAILFFNSSWISVGTRRGYFCKQGGYPDDEDGLVCVCVP
jgi:hypothetical protein